MLGDGRHYVDGRHVVTRARTMSQDSASSQASGQTQNYGYSSDGTEIDGEGDSQSSVSDDRSTQPIGEQMNDMNHQRKLVALSLPKNFHSNGIQRRTSSSLKSAKS